MKHVRLVVVIVVVLGAVSMLSRQTGGAISVEATAWVESNRTQIVEYEAALSSELSRIRPGVSRNHLQSVCGSASEIVRDVLVLWNTAPDDPFIVERRSSLEWMVTAMSRCRVGDIEGANQAIRTAAHHGERAASLAAGEVPWWREVAAS